MFTFVTGGQRSGRSNYALKRAAEQGPPPWLYVTAGEETDEAVRKRIQRHRRDREAIWRTAVMPSDLRTLLEPRMLDGVGAVVIDGFVHWMQGRLAAGGAADDPRLLEEVAEVADRLYRTTVPVVVVSAEMGFGVPPESAAQQRVLRVTASANQILAAMATSVVLMVSGVPLRVR